MEHTFYYPELGGKPAVTEALEGLKKAETEAEEAKQVGQRFLEVMVVWLVSIYRYCCEETNIYIYTYIEISMEKEARFSKQLGKIYVAAPAVHIFGSDLCVFCLHRYVDVCQNY